MSMRLELGESPALPERLPGAAVGQVEAVARAVRAREVDFAHHLARARGLDTEAPRNLSKVTLDAGWEVQATIVGGQFAYVSEPLATLAATGVPVPSTAEAVGR
jgi:hypothetical protein